ncbi:lipoprotein LpqH [Mycolicibacterium sp. 141076]|uniref:lipoprotein LpqH n=1 Tax=Mycobacteriaceae TaxID=1762 RepID=UPI00299DD77B|nr:lipoprotein LpqH [Mycolicibacterium sp. 141076]MDX1877000.1 lipoprotein LpqH [Mycolicibacterium sp. 141076]
MRVHRPDLVAVLGVLLISACESGTPTVTSIVFDGEPHTINTGTVVCTRQPAGGGLVILAQGKTGQVVRIQLTQVGRIVVQKVGLRDGDATGFVAEPAEITGIKVDDTYTVSGRMPPNRGESGWHTFKIQTACPGYQDAHPHDTVPAIGSP